MQQIVVAVSSISIVDENSIVVFILRFLKVFAIDDATDGGFARLEKRDEKSDDESSAEDPNGPVISGAEEPRLEEITIQENSHSRQNAIAGRCFDRAFPGVEERGHGDGGGCGRDRGSRVGRYILKRCCFGHIMDASGIDVGRLDVVLVSVESVHWRHKVNQDVDSQDDEHQKE